MSSAEITTYLTTVYYILSCCCGSRSTGSATVETTRTVSYRFGLSTTYSDHTVASDIERDCSCGKRYKATRIKGTKTDTACGQKCLHSKGHVCECSCGGANHGTGLAA